MLELWGMWSTLLLLSIPTSLWPGVVAPDRVLSMVNKSWRQHPKRHQLYGHLPPITKIIQVRRTRHAGHCWRSKDELISDVLLCTPTYGRAKAGRPDQTYIQQLCEDTGCSPEDLPEAMNDREKGRERVRDIHASGTTWWWMMICIRMDLALNNQEWLICHKTKSNQTKPAFSVISHLKCYFMITRDLKKISWYSS